MKTRGKDLFKHRVHIYVYKKRNTKEALSIPLYTSKQHWQQNNSMGMAIDKLNRSQFSAPLKGCVESLKIHKMNSNPSKIWPYATPKYQNHAHSMPRTSKIFFFFYFKTLGTRENHKQSDWDHSPDSPDPTG